MKKKTLIIGIIILVLIGILFLNNNITGLFTINNKKTIKIGILTDLSGDMSSWGKSVQQGIELARQNSNSNIKIIYEDSKCDQKTGINATNKLVNIDNVDLIYGTVCSHVTLGAAPITEKNNKILLSVAASNPEISYAGDHVYRLWPSDLIESKSIIEYISTKMPEIKTIGIIYMNNDYGVAVKNSLVNFSKENNLKVTSIESFLQNDTDFKTQLSKIKERKPDGLFVIANPPEAVIIFNQIKELNITEQLFAPGWLMEDSSVNTNISKEILEKTIFPNLEFNISNNFKTKLNKSPNIIASELAYDGYNILNIAVNKCNKNINCIKKELDTIDYNGVTGNIKFDKHGDIIKSFKIKQFKDGKIRELS